MNLLDKWTRGGKFVLIMLAIVYLFSLVKPFFLPMQAVIGAILIPLLLAGFFYYLLRPVVAYMERYKIKRSLAILILYVVLVILTIGFIAGVWPLLGDQLFNLVQNIPNFLVKLDLQIKNLGEDSFLSKILPSDSNLLANLTDYLSKGIAFLSNYLSSFISFLSQFAIVLFTFPILLYYMLKEGHRFKRGLAKLFPLRYRRTVFRVTRDMDKALNDYIIGRVIVNLALGVLMFIGFIIIGLPYALLLTLIAVILNFIPMFGAIISSVPIVIIGLIESPSTGIWALVIILVAQQIQDNVISPYVFGKKLDIHPVTTILLVLGSGNWFGIIGMLVVIPVYMILKIVWRRIYILFISSRWENL
ncbi:AI-2E family transporter [Paenibacillus sp. Marseille-P2973]|uniref:AI-2E family transporter n=1 Tax=Paenibacillus TaxID=44249 RepID=UPI001B37CC35|nr:MULTISPECIES: AI-2E family transporter [Paenibacillus]MBQ4897748.1 AI-2E family transporter [Paenibacillus sp. Marseille-P2973]MDN4067118.1 AI-2E family transporter [Paenibacillus vini]